MNDSQNEALSTPCRGFKISQKI